MVIAAVAVLFLTSYSQNSVSDTVTSSQERSLAGPIGRGPRAIEGTWNGTVTIRNCQTGAALVSFRAMDLFIQGGALVDTNAAPPSTRGPGFGSWEFLGDHRYTATLRFFLYNPDGSFAGVRRIAQDITVGEDNNSWESTVAIAVFDPAGNQVATACATAAATRAE